MTILVTGGAGFIGSNFIVDCLAKHDEPIINLDKLTYAGNLENLRVIENDDRYQFIKTDIGNCALISEILTNHKPRAIINFAAESQHWTRLLHPRRFRHPE